MTKKEGISNRVKKYFILFAVAMLLPITASAKSLESYCSLFEDDWFPEIVYTWGSCAVNNLEPVPVNIGGVSFDAFLSVHYEDKYREILKESISKAKYPVRILTDKQAILIQDDKIKFVGEGPEIKL
ncbi:hypothetical protein KKC65_03505 [Patescibacteria group bacterium]|nr:hypothetical protein [Patescibacteria group bacterium]